MFCEKCGSKNPNDAMFCENCGTPLQSMAEPPFKPDTSSNNGQHYNSGSNGIPIINTPVAQKTPHKPLSKLTMAIVAEVLVIICMVYALYGLGRDYFGPKQRAKEFFEYMANAEWSKAYDMLDVDESEFINEKFFEKAMRTTSFGNVVSYNVKSGSTSSSSTKDVNVNYTNDDSADKLNYKVSLNKDKKKLLIFDNWTVSSESMVCSNYMIYVPSGATVTFDGVELDDKYIYPDSYSTDTVTYGMPNIFIGCHDITVSKEGMEDVSETVMIVTSFQEYELKSMTLKEETVQEIEELAYKNVKKIYEAAIKNESFSSIEDMFSENESYRENVNDSYEYLCDSLNDDYFSPHKIEFNNITEKLEYDDGLISVSFQMSYVADYTYVYWDGDSEEKKSEGRANVTIEFINEDGKWVQSYIVCPGIY